MIINDGIRIKIYDRDGNTLIYFSYCHFLVDKYNSKLNKVSSMIFFGKEYKRENFNAKAFDIFNKSSLTIKVIL